MAVGLGDARPAGDVLRLTRVLGDGDDYLVGVRFADDSEITVLVSVDANLNSAVKDAFVIPDTLRAVSGQMVELLDAEQRLEVTAAAEARDVIEQAIELGAMFVPPIESETCPVQRPLVEWAVGLLPEGGPFRAVEPVSEDQLDDAVAALMSSPEGAGLRGGYDSDLARLALRFAADCTGGDPWRWSPVNVEMVLSWVPERVIADTEYLARLPEVLTVLVTYAHRVGGVPPHLTRETTDAVAERAPRYAEQIADSARALNPVVSAVLDELGPDSPADLAQLSTGPGSVLPVKDLLAWFDVRGSVSQRAEPLLRAVGADPWGVGLGSADLLVSARRRRILAWRDDAPWHRP